MPAEAPVMTTTGVVAGRALVPVMGPSPLRRRKAAGAPGILAPAPGPPQRSPGGGPADPAPPLEEVHQDQDGQHLETDTEVQERGPPGDVADEELKFWPKNPVRKLRGRKMVAMIVSCFITTFSRLDTVDTWVSMTPEEVAVAVDQVGDADQVVVEVTEVACPSDVIPGSSTTPGRQGGEHVACGVITLRMPISDRFRSKRTPSCASVGWRRISSSSWSMRSSNSLSTGKNESTMLSTMR